MMVFNKSNKILHLGLFTLLISLLISCENHTIYSKYKKVNNYIWNYNNSIDFEFKIKDTLSVYNMHFRLRNAGVFPYSNVWIMINGYKPDGQEFIAQRYEFILADDSGKWTGKGLGDIIDNDFLILENIKFPKTGDYKIKVRHDMRIEQLPGIMDVGISVKKVKN